MVEQQGNTRTMTGDELKSMLKSSIRLKSLGGLKHPGLKLSEDDLAWWRQAKFGMFIHWGLYSMLGRGEWVMHNEKISVAEYRKLAADFKPQNFDADVWAQIAADAGMKYMVMVARHHDGFALWDSPGSYQAFTSAAMGAKRDFVKEYTLACRKAGLKVGLYYSPMDWRFPGYFQPRELLENALLMKEQTHKQVEELVSKYGTIDILWYDGAWLAHKGHDPDGAWLWDPIKLNQMVRSYNPKTIINPRSGWEGDFYCDEGSHAIQGDIIPVPWEKCLSIGSGTSWGWIPDDPVRSLEYLITMLVNVVVRDGNVLLNVGPDANGLIPVPVVNRLKEMGQWMKEKGESIYDTRGGPFPPVDGIYGTTHRGRKIYVHILDQQKFEGLLLPACPRQIVAASMLNGDPLAWHQDSSGIRINVPSLKATPPDTVVVLELDSPLPAKKGDDIYFTG